MGFWVIGFLVLLVALLVPILAIVLDSPALRNLVERRLGPGSSDLKQLADRVTVLEDEIEDLNRALQSVRDETQFLQRLLENPEHRPAPPPS